MLRQFDNSNNRRGVDDDDVDGPSICDDDNIITTDVHCHHQGYQVPPRLLSSFTSFDDDKIAETCLISRRIVSWWPGNGKLWKGVVVVARYLYSKRGINAHSTALLTRLLSAKLLLLSTRPNYEILSSLCFAHGFSFSRFESQHNNNNNNNHNKTFASAAVAAAGNCEKVALLSHLVVTQSVLTVEIHPSNGGGGFRVSLLKR